MTVLGFPILILNGWIYSKRSPFLILALLCKVTVGAAAASPHACGWCVVARAPSGRIPSAVRAFAVLVLLVGRCRAANSTQKKAARWDCRAPGGRFSYKQ